MIDEQTINISAAKYQLLSAEAGALRQRNTYLEDIYIPWLVRDLRDMIKDNKDLDNDFKNALMETFDERVYRYEDNGAIDNTWLERKYSEIKGSR